MAEEGVQLVPVDLNGTVVRIEARSLGGPQKVAVADALPFTQVTDALKAMGDALSEPLKTLGGQKVSVELGVEIGIEAGKLVALFTNLSGKANLKVNIEWQENSKK